MNRFSWYGIIWSVYFLAMMFSNLNLRETLCALALGLSMCAFCIAEQFYKRFVPHDTVVNISLPEQETIARVIRTSLDKGRIRIPRNVSR